jgi:hypothetical protein
MSSWVKESLQGGNRTSVGNAADVVDVALKSDEVLDEVYGLFFDEDPVVVMRSSYVAMRVAEQKPESVQRFKASILENLENYKQQEIRWHIPQLLMHVDLTSAERERAYYQLMHWAETDSSKIVAYYSLPTAAKFATEDEQLMSDFRPRLRVLSQSGAKSVENRCKKIAKQLKVDLDAL